MLTELLDIAAKAKARMLAQYAGSTTLVALVGELGGAVQDLETAIFGIISQGAIDTAEGVWLDRIGRIIGEPRDGGSDAEYRNFLRARIVANRSSGRIEDVIAVVAAWNGGGAPSLTLKVLPPANFELVVVPLVPQDVLERFVRLVRATRAAGIGAMVITRPQSNASSFAFADTKALGSIEPEPSSTQGFGDSTAPNVGGRFISAVRA